MLKWTPWALPGLAVLFIGLGLAWFIYRARPDRTQNRLLAIQLSLEALAVGLLGGAAWIFTDAQLVRALGLTSLFLVWPKLWSYYSFLATLDTPLARPLQRRGVLRGLLVVTLLLGSSVFFWPEWYGVEANYWPAVQALAMAPGRYFMSLMWMWSLVWIVGLSFSISALRHASTSLRREQARAYAIAFGIRDVCFVLSTLSFTFVPLTNQYFHWIYLAFPTVWLIYYPLVAWGILRHQLFDIELHVKRGVQRSFVAGAIATAFFVGNYTLEQFIDIHNFALGLIAAGFVTFAIQPLQRLAEQVANRLMPGVHTSPEYLQDRKHDVYRNAVEGAFQDGHVSERERAILQRLRASLDLEEPVAAEIELDVVRTLTREAAPLTPALMHARSGA